METKKQARITIRLPKETLDAARKMALVEGRAVADWARRAITFAARRAAK